MATTNKPPSGASFYINESKSKHAPKLIKNLKNQLFQLNTQGRMLLISGLMFCLSLASISLWQVTNIPLLVKAASQPNVTISAPANVLVGNNFSFTATFDNTSVADTGFGPYIDLIIPFNGANGVNGNIIPNDPNESDGVQINSASYLGSSTPIISLIFPDSGGGSGCVLHPFAVDNTGSPLSICGIAGDQLIVTRLPFGSFVPEQPAAVVTFSASLSNKANLGVPLTIRAKGGFYFGEDEFNNPSIDPSNVQASYNNTTVTPQVVVMNKSLNAPEGETATGPNYPREFTLSATIAPGQVINNFQFNDSLPNNLVYQNLVTATPGCTVANPIPVTTGPASPNPLTIDCGTVTGPGPITTTYRVFVPKDDSLSTPIIDPNTGDTAASTNSATASGNWVPIDTRDNGGSFTTAAQSQTLSDKSIAIQKSHIIAVDNNYPSYTPQDVIEYTLNIQVSDFFAFNNVEVVDVISDGQHFDTSFTPTLSFQGQSINSNANFNSSSFNFVDSWTGAPSPVGPINGSSTANFDISSELINRGYSGKLIGGCIPTTGTTSIDCANYNAGATTAVIKYRAIIQETFTDNFPSGNPNVDLGDTMSNNVSINGDLLQTTDVSTPTSFDQSDTSSDGFKIVEASLAKNIYAVNGNITIPSELFPGDIVTYSIEYNLPTSDLEQLQLIDYLPKPVFGTTSFSTTFNPTNVGIPAVNTSQFGPNDTFYAISNLQPILSKDNTQNSIKFDYPVFNINTNVQSRIQLLFSVQVSDSPFADGLFLTNQAVALQQNTNSTPFSSTQINQIRLRQPNLKVNKGVISTTNSNTTFSPNPAFNTPITFQNPGSNVCSSFAGTINSNYLTNNPINSNAAGVDGSDLVRYAVTVENSGGSGAFETVLQELLPANMQIPSGGLNLCVSDGSGAAKSFTDLSGGLFGTGIRIDDPSSTVAGILPFNLSSGQNVLVLTYDLQIKPDADLGQIIENQATITGYSNMAGGRNIAGELFDKATVTPIPVITLQKSFINTTEPVANDNNGAVGSLVTYRSSFNVPEGKVNNVQYNDILTPGLALVSVGNISFNPLVTSSLGTPAAINAAIIVANNGRNFNLNFGDLTNLSDSNSIIETITIDYTAVITNAATNQSGVNLNNTANLSYNSLLSSASSSAVQVVDPNLEVIKTIAPISGDAEDSFLVTLNVRHRGDSTANSYEVSLSDVLPTHMEFVGSLTNSSGVVPVTLTETSGTIAATWNSLNLGQNSIITFVVKVNNLVTPGETITNSANINWSSMPGNVSLPQSIYDSTSIERTGNNTGSGNVSITDFGVIKQITNTNINDNDVNSNAITTGSNVVIGEEVEYTTTITIPEGQANNFQYVDTFDQGLAFKNIVSINSNSPSVTTTNIFASVISGVTVTAVTDPGQRFTLNFGNLVNSDTNNSQAETITIVYRAIVTNIASNQTGVTRINSARVVWDLNSLPRSVQTTSPAVTIVEPSLTINKTSSVASVQAGDTVTYTVTLTNTSSVPIQDVNFRDTLPAHTTLVNGSFTNNTAYTHIFDASAFPIITDFIPQINVGQTLTLTYQITINIGVTPNQILSNSSEARWSSLNGNYTLAQSTFNPVSTERTGLTNNPGGVLNDYIGTSVRNIQVVNLTAVKSIVSTSESQTATDGLGRSTVNIGEIVRYRLVTSVPQSTTANLNILENIPTGLQYLNDGTTMIAFVSNGVGISSSTISGVGLNVTGNSGNVAPTFVLPSGSVTPSSFSDGTDPTFNFGQIVNNDSDADGEFVVVEFNALVTNVLSNQAGIILNNTYAARNGAVTLVSSTAANSNRLVVWEPNISIAKTVTITPTDASDAVQYQILVRNNAGTNVTSAYNLQVSDTLDGNLILQNNSISPLLGSTDNSNIGSNLVSYSIPTLAAGQSATITINATVIGGVVTNQVIPNTASLVYESLSNDSKNPNVTGSINSNVAGNPSGPRNGQVSNTLNNYINTSSVSLNLGGATITKLNSPKSTYTIGEVVEYPIRVTLAEGQTRSVVVTDLFPNGLQYVNSSVVSQSSLSGGLLSADWNGDVLNPVITGGITSGDPVIFTFGNLNNSNDNVTNNNSFLIRVQAVVVNQLSNQSVTSLTNSSRIDWRDANNNNFNATSNTSPITLTEPDLNLTKSSTDNTPNQGQTLTYSLTVNHLTSSTSDAFDLSVVDNLPSSLTYIPGSSVLPVGWTVDETNPSSLIFTTNNLTLLQSSATITYQATVNNSLAIGTNVTNSANLQWTSLSGNVAQERTGVDGTGNVLNNYSVDASNSAIVTGIDLAITKTDTLTVITPNQFAAYRLRVTNNGNTISNGVTITETVPANTTFVSTSSTAGWSCSDGAVAGTTCTFNLGSIGVGATSSFVIFVVRVTASVPSGVTTITNTATTTDNGANGVDTNPLNNSATDIDTLDAAPDMQITKTDGLTSTAPGQTLTYNLSVTNDGNQNATGVTITDTLPAGLTYVSSSNGGILSGNTITWPLLANFNTSTTVNRTVTVTVNNPLAAGINTLTNTASVVDDGANGLDLNPTNNTASDTDMVDASPDLNITITDVGVTTTPGQVVTYEIGYGNSGFQDATGVVVSITVPIGSTFNSASSTAGWSCSNGAVAGTICTFIVGNLNVNANGSVNFAVLVNNPLAAGINQLNVTTNIQDDGTNGTEINLLNNQAIENTPINATPEISITKTDNLTTVVPGQTISYILTVANNGNQDATGVIVSDTLPNFTSYLISSNSGTQNLGIVTWPLFNLAAGASVIRTVTVQIDSAIPSLITSIVNQATANDDGANGNDPIPGNNLATDTDTLVASPDLTITKTDGGATVTPGQNITYTINYNNVGNQTADNVIVTETVPANTTFVVSGSSIGWSCSDGAIAGTACTLALGSLNALASGSLTYIVKINDPLPSGISVINNTVVIADDGLNGADPTPSNNTDLEITSANPQHDLSISKTDNRTIAVPGEVLTYNIVYANSGNQDLTGVVVTETVPLQTTFDLAGSSTGWSCGNGSVGGTICTNTIGSLAADTTGSLNFAVRINSAIDAGFDQVDNIASIDDDGFSGPDIDLLNNTGSDVTLIDAAPDLTITKTDDLTVINQNQTLTYTLTITNNGNKEATGVIVKDDLPLELTYVSSSDSGTILSQQVTWPIFNLIPGQSVTRTVTAELVIPGTLNYTLETVTNNADVTDDGTNGADLNPGDNFTSDTDIVNGNPDLVITKTDNQTQAQVGSIVIYQLNVTNVGDQDAGLVTISETVPNESTWNPSSSTPGWVCTNSGVTGSECTFSVGTLAAGSNQTISFGILLNSIRTTDQLSNTTSVQYDPISGTDPTPENNTATDTDNIVGVVDLAISKTNNQSQVQAGQNTTYNIIVTNNSNIVVTGIVVTDPIPSLSSYIGSDNGGVYNSSNQSVIWSGISLLPGESTVLQLTVLVNSAIPVLINDFTNTVSVVDDATHGVETDIANNSATDTDTLIAQPDLTIVIGTSSANIYPNENVDFTINYSNIGLRDASRVIIKITIPVNLKVNPSTLTAGWVCSGSGIAGDICQKNIGNLVAAQNGSLILPLSTVSSFDSNTTQITIPTNILDDGANGSEITMLNNFSQTNLLVPRANLIITKTPDKTQVKVQELLNYRFVFRNLGPDNATNVVMQDILPANLQFLTATRGGVFINTNPINNSDGTTTLVFAIGGLLAGQEDSLIVETRIRGSQIGTFINEVSIIARESDPEISNNRSNASVEILPDPKILPIVGGIGGGFSDLLRTGLVGVDLSRVTLSLILMVLAIAGLSSVFIKPKKVQSEEINFD